MEDDIIRRAKEKTKAAFVRKQAKRGNWSLTASSLSSAWRSKCEQAGFGNPSMMNQQEWLILKGFVKLCLSNDKEPEDVYRMLDEVVENWDHLRRMPIQTLKGVPVSLPVRPSLVSFLTCRESILDAISALKCEAVTHTVHPSMDKVLRTYDSPTINTQKPMLRRKTPTQEEIDREYMEREDE
jgi:hypothetical protein